MRRALILFGLTLVAMGHASYAHASSLSATWYFVPAPVGSSGDQDFATYNVGGPGIVTNTLGPDGLPVLQSPGDGGVSDYNTTTDEILWWSLQDPNVSLLTTMFPAEASVYPTTVTLPFADDNVFYDATGINNGTGDDNAGFVTATLEGTFDMASPGSVSFTGICGDDDVYIYVDDTLQVDLGGVHSETCSSGTITDALGAGTHTLDIFYADRQVSDAVLDVSFDEALTPVNAVPEPATLVLFGTGCLGVVGAIRRRRSARTTV